MKLLIISLLFVLPVHGMQRPRQQNQRRPATLATDPNSLADLSRDLLVAVRDVDTKKTKLTLDALAKLGKKTEELSCLEEEVMALATSLQKHYEKRSEKVAELSASALLQKLTTTQSKNTAFPEASEIAVYDHGNTIMIYNMLNNFFLSRTQPYSECTFSLTPPPPSVSHP